MEIFYVTVAIISLVSGVGYIYEKVTKVIANKKKIEKGTELNEFYELEEKEPDLVKPENEYRLPVEADLKKGDWSWVYNGSRLPFIASGNFFGDGKLAHAILLISNDEKSVKIIVKRHDSSEEMTLLCINRSPFNIDINVAEKGEHKSFWEKYNLKLMTHGIRVTFLEVSEFIYYWDKDNNEFERYCTSD